MKKLLVCVLVLALLSGLASCAFGDNADVSILELDGFSMSMPSNWLEDEVEEGGITYHRFFKTSFVDRWSGFLRIYTYGLGYSFDADVLGDSAYDGYFFNLGGSDIRRESIEICGELASLWSANINYGISGNHRTYGIVLLHDALALCVLYVDDSSSSQDNLDFLRTFAESIHIPGYEAPQEESLVSLDEIDLSGMSYDELVALKDRINLAMWESDEWQEVTVPIGIWKVGEDIPAGHWTIKIVEDKSYAKVVLGKDIDENEASIVGVISDDLIASENHNFYKTVHRSEVSLVLLEGQYIWIQSCPVVFTPYTGKPDLCFN